MFTKCLTILQEFRKKNSNKADLNLGVYTIAIHGRMGKIYFDLS
jgi:hypothetical protein